MNPRLSWIRLVGLVALCSVTASCSNLVGSLRRDLDDSPAYEGPTVGGRFSEFGQIAGDDLERNNPYGTLGHRERGLASDRVSRRDGSWLGGDADSDRGTRPHGRTQEYGDEQESMTFSQNPNLVSPAMQRQYRGPGGRATRRDFQDDGVNEGSLWASDGQTNYYFTKNKIRGVGDLVTVKVEENLLKDTHREVRRTLSQREKEYEVAAAQERLNKKALGQEETPASGGAPAGPAAAAAPKKDQAASSQAAPARSEPAAPREATTADIDVSKNTDLAAGDVVMAEILERFPNGNYKIRGTKRINYRGSSRMMNFIGIVRGSDIGEDDTVASGKLYEYQLEVIR